MKKIKGVIFDLDGTLGDTLPICIKAFQLALEPILKRSLTATEIMSSFGPSEEGVVMSFAPHEYQRGIEGYLHHYKALHHMCPDPFDGVMELLDDLQDRDIRIAMVTGKGKHSAAISLEQFRMEKYFEMIEVGIPEGPRKTEGIQCVLDRFHAYSKDQFIYVGDSPSDIITSRQVGIPVVAAAWAETAEYDKLRDTRPDQMFRKVPAFTRWLGTVI